MLERVLDRGRAIAERAAGVQRKAAADRLRDQDVPGVQVSEEGETILLSGRALRLRFALEPALRWLTAVIR
jgi:hypothetical protein